MLLPMWSNTIKSSIAAIPLSFPAAFVLFPLGLLHS